MFLIFHHKRATWHELGEEMTLISPISSASEAGGHFFKADTETASALTSIHSPKYIVICVPTVIRLLHHVWSRIVGCQLSGLVTLAVCCYSQVEMKH